MPAETSSLCDSVRLKGTSAQAIAVEIERMILAGALTAGERIRERPLAGRLGVSRGPVREALRLLQSRGLVQVEPMRGATVSPLAGEDVAELLDIGAALLVLAVRRAAARRSSEEAHAIATGALSLQAVAERLSPAEFTTRANAVLGQAVSAARMVRLAHLSQDISLRGVAVAFEGKSYLTKQRRAQAARNCVRLAEAIAARDELRAEKIGQRLCHQNRRAAEQTRRGPQQPEA